MGTDANTELEAHGFFALDDLRERVRRAGSLGREEPALVVTSVARTRTQSGNESLAYSRTLDSGSRVEGAGSAKAYLERAAFLAKRPGNPFPQMISLGRARNSDVVLALGTVSKVQCYFMQTPDGWAVVDQRSKNGTFLNGEALEAGEKTPLKDGDQLRFGDDVTCRFSHAVSLESRLRQI